MGNKTKESPEDDVDALFQLPLAEFTPARNALAARLKKEGRADDATLVKALTKPSVSAWAVNQLYWKHRDSFTQLIATGQRFHQAQKSISAGKIADMRGSLEARRQSLSQLTDLATALLQKAGHNPTPDMARRITTTLEGLSASASLADGPTPGRLTHDVDPPGFEALATLMAVPGVKGKDLLKLVTPSSKPAGVITKPPSKSSAGGAAQNVRQLEDTRRATIAAAKMALQEAKKSLSESRAAVQRLESAKKKAHTEAKRAEAEAKRAETEMREAEQLFMQAKTASQDAARRAQAISSEAEEALRTVEDARRAADQATKELESLLRN